MTLANASVAQLFAWQCDIVEELARRANLAAAPQAPRPPWEQAMVPVPQQPQVVQTVARAPSMLGGQQPIGPGVVVATQRTDPALAAVFAATPPRYEGVPGNNGNGRGEGQITFGGGE